MTQLWQWDNQNSHKKRPTDSIIGIRYPDKPLRKATREGRETNATCEKAHLCF